MGIRVVCPNGHRLNLKSHLAGHHGLCPQCSARFLIPRESSDSPLEHDTRTDESNPVNSPAAADSPDTPNGVQNSPVAVSAPVEPKVSPQTQATVPGSGDNSIVKPGDFAPQSVWYVQAIEGGKAGERFGPAPGDMMQAWIAEGRILPDYLVWRDGWSDWQLGSSILAGSERSDNVNPTGPATSAIPVIEESLSGRSAGSLANRSKWKPALVILLALVGLVLALGVGLAMMTGQI